MNGRKPQPQLKAVLIQEGLTQRELARLTGIPEHYISMAIHGKFNLDEVQMAKIATALGIAQSKLFPQAGLRSV